jgi:hypothetical protein
MLQPPSLENILYSIQEPFQKTKEERYKRKQENESKKKTGIKDRRVSL